MSGVDVAPNVKRVRAYFAPVDRVAKKPTMFDPAQDGSFNVDAPPSPWVDLGWVTEFTRTSGTVVGGLKTGAPASTKLQVRSDVDATVTLAFESWGKLQLALSCGVQQMNLLAAPTESAVSGSGGTAIAATTLLTGSTSTALNVGTAAALFAVGSLVVVDVDYVAGTTGFVGAGVSGAYVKATLSDPDYVRRVSLNVARVASVSGGVLTLQSPLPAGGPAPGMKVSAVVGFCDREGSSFFQEWSALFVAEGQQGDRVIWHYPRLQACAGIAEDSGKGLGGFTTLRLAGQFRALPVIDPVDGESVLCFRSYVNGLL